MSEFKNTAVVRLVGPGGTLNIVMADSTDSEDIDRKSTRLNSSHT